MKCTEIILIQPTKGFIDYAHSLLLINVLIIYTEQLNLLLLICSTSTYIATIMYLLLSIKCPQNSAPGPEIHWTSQTALYNRFML